MFMGYLAIVLVVMLLTERQAAHNAHDFRRPRAGGGP
jgi:hypothetical protein